MDAYDRFEFKDVKQFEGLSPQVITNRSNAMLLLWFILIVNVCPLSVCLWLTVQFI